MKMLRFILLAGPMMLGIGSNPLRAATEISDADLALFRDYLAKNQLNAHWESDAPRRIDSDEIRRAYGDRHFYFTFKAAPLPPGAQLPNLIEDYQRALQEYQKHSLRITVSVDNKQRVAAFRDPEDFNLGLMGVKTDDDARVAAAAILSLIGNNQVHPGVINPHEVNVTRVQSGWGCTVTRPRAFDGKVAFDTTGHCTSATKNLNYVPLLPP